MVEIMSSPENCHVYVVISCGVLTSSTFIKVGISSNPSKRMKEVQTGCPVPVRVANISKPCSRMDARTIESRLHKILMRFNSSGEWFTGLPLPVIHRLKSLDFSDAGLLNLDDHIIRLFLPSPIPRRVESRNAHIESRQRMAQNMASAEVQSIVEIAFRDGVPVTELLRKSGKRTAAVCKAQSNY